MSVAADLFTLGETAARLGLDRDLVTFLFVTNDVPHRQVGRAKLIDEAGVDTIRRAAATYKRKLARVAV